MFYKEWKTVRFKVGLLFVSYLLPAVLLIVIWFVTHNQRNSMYYTWFNISTFLTVAGGIFGGIDLVSEESDKGTLSFLLTRPLPRGYIYLSKFLVNITGLVGTYWGVSLLVLIYDQLSYRPFNLSEAIASTLLITLIGVLVAGVSGLLSIFTSNAIQTLLVSVVAVLPIAGILAGLDQVLRLDVLHNYYSQHFLTGNLLADLLVGALGLSVIWLGARAFERRQF